MELQSAQPPSRRPSFHRSASAYARLQKQQVDIADDLSSRSRRSRRSCILAAFLASFILLLAIAAFLFLHFRSISSTKASASPAPHSEASAVIEAACNATSFPSACVSLLSSPSDSSSSTTPLQLASLSLAIAIASVRRAASLLSSASVSILSPPLAQSAVQDCVELTALSDDLLNATLSLLHAIGLRSGAASLGEMKVQLSGVLGHQLACEDELEAGARNSSAAAAMAAMAALMEAQANVTVTVRIALGIVDFISGLGSDLSSWKKVAEGKLHVRRRKLLEAEAVAEGKLLEAKVEAVAEGKLLEADAVEAVAEGKLLEVEAVETGGKLLEAEAERREMVECPDWLTAADRRRLDGGAAVAADVVVAKDGSGNFSTIQAALDEWARTRPAGYIVYIKTGVYEEYIEITKAMSGLTMVGDGPGATVITGSKSNAQGIATSLTSTVVIKGAHFMARGITFRNTAGPSGYQAVALKAMADFGIFVTCSFEGYQDTLYASAFRQFYTGCTIYGTIDFIFGDAIAIFQNCQIIVRQPLPNQFNTVTAHGRNDQHERSGYSFQKCEVKGDTDLQSSIVNYLGRPWRPYACTVFMQSTIGGLINSAGWTPWDAVTDPTPAYVYYGEYLNSGAGADTSLRVTWPGVHSALTEQDAENFTVDTFISGSSWLTSADVQYQDSL